MNPFARKPFHDPEGRLTLPVSEHERHVSWPRWLTLDRPALDRFDRVRPAASTQDDPDSPLATT